MNHTPASPKNQAASAAINKLLTAAGVNATVDAQIDVSQVYNNDGSGKSTPREFLTINVSSPDAALQPLVVANAVNAVLNKIPALDNMVQFESDGEHATLMKHRLENLIKAGATVPNEYLKWGGYIPAIEEKADFRNPLKKYTVSRTYDDVVGSHATLDIPVAKEQLEDVKAFGEHIEKNIKDRLTDIKADLADRIIRYGKIEDPKRQAEIKAQTDKLEFKIELNNSDTNETQSLTANIFIQSPDQLAALAKPGSVGSMKEAQQEALHATNPLHELSGNHLSKAIAGALLHAGDKAEEIFPLIAGREDMRRAMEKQLEELRTAKPDMSAEIDSFLADDTFKDNNKWGRSPTERPDLETRPEIKTTDEGKLQIRLQLPDGKAGEIIEALASQTPAEAQEQAASIAKPQTAMGAALGPQQQDKAMAEAINTVLRKYQEAALTR
ncbi:MAG: hypothetical protein AB7L92_04895 [Alphaproteobacteria bacterium]